MRNLIVVMILLLGVSSANAELSQSQIQDRAIQTFKDSKAMKRLVREGFRNLKKRRGGNVEVRFLKPQAMIISSYEMSSSRTVYRVLVTQGYTSKVLASKRPKIGGTVLAVSVWVYSDDRDPMIFRIINEKQLQTLHYMMTQKVYGGGRY